MQDILAPVLKPATGSLRGSGRRAAIVAVLVLLQCRAAGANDWEPPARFLGTVEIRGVHDSVNADPPSATAPVALRARPDEDSPVGTVVAHWRRIRHVEHGYEEYSAAVLERAERKDGTWYRVSYDDRGTLRDGWLSPAQAGRYRPISEILIGSLAYMTDAWDGRLRTQPGNDKPFAELRKTDRKIYAEVSDFASPDGEPWVLVTVSDGSVCDDGPPTPLGRGWVPLFPKGGKPAVWYFPRGC